MRLKYQPTSAVLDCTFYDPTHAWSGGLHHQLKMYDLNTDQENLRENQDGGIGRHTAPPRTTRTDRKSNGNEVRHQGNKKETFIHTGRRGGDGHWGGEDSRCCGGTETGGVWD